MNQSDLKEFTKLFRNEAELYPQTTAVTSGRIQAYFESLSRFDLEAIRAALIAIRERSEFFPTIRAVVEALEGSGDDRANQAWATFFAATGDSGYASIKFLDPAAAAAVIATFGGWLQACRELRDAEAPMVAHYRKNFVQAYSTARKFPREVETYQAGLFELQNRGGGAWSARIPFFTGTVILCGLRESKELRLPFDSTTGQLTAAAQSLVNAASSPEGARQLIEWASQSAQTAIGVGVPKLTSEPSQPLSHAEAVKVLAEVEQHTGLRLLKPMPEVEAA